MTSAAIFLVIPVSSNDGRVWLGKGKEFNAHPGIQLAVLATFRPVLLRLNACLLLQG